MPRVKILRVNPDWLANLLRLDGKWLVKIDGLPPDARIIGISDQMNFESGMIGLKVESEEFRNIESGSCIEWMTLDVTITDPILRIMATGIQAANADAMPNLLPAGFAR